MLIISVLDKIFEFCKKYVIHRDHCQTSIKKFKNLESELIWLHIMVEASEVWGIRSWVNLLCKSNIFS